ncbi:hypothetical protein Trydic_g8379 [Trypoxylus dichotomus]
MAVGRTFTMKNVYNQDRSTRRGESDDGRGRGGEGNRQVYRCHRFVGLAWAYPARLVAAPGSSNDNGKGAPHAREQTNGQPPSRDYVVQDLETYTH